MNVVPSTSGEPRGYCPSCGYRMDPGRCSECGCEVSERILATKPSKWYRNRILGVTLWIISLCVIGFVVNQTIRKRMHINAIPASILLELSDSHGNWAQLELVKRAKEGSLSKDHLDRMFNCPPVSQLASRACYPSGAPVPIAFVSELAKAYDVGFLVVDEIELEIDQEQINQFDFGPSFQDWVQTVGNAKIHIHKPFVLPFLSEGLHVIRVSGLLSMRCGREHDPIYTWPFEVHQRIEIDGRSIDQLATPIWSQELSAQLTGIALAGFQRARWGPTFDGEDLQIKIAGPFSTNLAAFVQVRGTGDLEWEDTGHIFVRTVLDSVEDDYGSEGRIGYGQDGLVSHYGPLFDIPAVEKDGPMDIRLIPNATLAYNHGLSEYFSGIIEWVDVEKQDSRGYNGPTPESLPASITPWIPDPQFRE